jgi:hypothetical protein
VRKVETVSPGDGTVLLPLLELTALFERNKSVISRHVWNIFEEGELDNL